jgi:acyl-CoA synthetase (AMP-forming)/AMP-acid ligase II
VGIFRRNRRRPQADISIGERRAYVEPVMDRELPVALFAAALAAIVLVAIQVQSSSAAQKKEAASRARTAYSVQHRPDSRLASSQQNFADSLEQRAH